LKKIKIPTSYFAGTAEDNIKKSSRESELQTNSNEHVQ